jgi:hypothetical protein
MMTPAGANALENEPVALLRSRRLETVLGAAVDELTADDIQALPGKQVAEAFDLDFKAVLYGNGDSQRRDLCGDVAALANTSGGVIILGVTEDDHAVACATPGVQLSDAERNRMLQVLASGTAPMPACEVITVRLAEDSDIGWYLLAVPRSQRAPHAVIVNEGFRFPVRNGTTIRYLSEPEIAGMYRLRDRHAGDLQAQLLDLAATSFGSIDRQQGPWITVTLVPEHPGTLEINQRQLNAMKRAYATRDVSDIQSYGAHFEWVRPSRGKYIVGEGPYGPQESPLPRYAYAELGTDGAGSYAVRLVDLGEVRRSNSGQVQDSAAPQVVSDESLALRLLTGLRRLASHARDTTGAAGSAVVQAHLAPSPGRDLEIGHSRQYGIPRSRSQASLTDAFAVAETAASLDDLVESGPELVAAAARLLDELGTSFGIAEMGQLTQNGAIRRRYWADAAPLTSWAQLHGVEMTDETIDGGGS